jgi:ribonuclease Y
LGLIAAVLIGLVVGGMVAYRLGTRSSGSAELQKAHRILEQAETEAKAQAVAHREQVDAELSHQRLEVETASERIHARESTLEQRAANLAQREETVASREREIIESQEDVHLTQELARDELERIAALDHEAAKDELMAIVEEEVRRDSMVLVRDSEIQAREEADRRARRILATAIQRLSAEVVAETTVSVIHLPSDEMKGRIIGRDGRNIRAFEQTSGVSLIVDDTPGSVSVSSFDPIRREIARVALNKLVADGRIHPSSIEEAIMKASAEVDQSIRDAGEWVLLEVGVSRMESELVTLLGRLKYRTSYGQSVLDHSVEAAALAGLLAAELGLEQAPAKRAALLHDIGKAVSHEVGGSHALVGAEIARRFGEDASIVHAIEAHHNEVEPRTVLAVITQAADAISAARPGARREQLETYVKRLSNIEDLASSFRGVEKVYAMQAGRELRVIVDPGVVSDSEASSLAREIAKKIEADVQYPGQVQVTVIRELRSTFYAQ